MSSDSYSSNRNTSRPSRRGRGLTPNTTAKPGFLPGQETLAYHAERIKQISGSDRYRITWADHDAQDRFEFEHLGIKTTPAKKDIHLGIEAVQACLKVQGDGKPRLFIFKTCPNTIREMTGYRWAEGTEARDPKDEPLKVNDHTNDALRYAIYGIEGKSYFSQDELR